MRFYLLGNFWHEINVIVTYLEIILHIKIEAKMKSLVTFRLCFANSGICRNGIFSRNTGDR